MPQRPLAWDDPESRSYGLAARLRERKGPPTPEDIADAERIAESWTIAR